MNVAGRKGRFNWNVPPQYDKGIGGGRSPMHAFETEDGELYFHRLEKDLQGGRWELAPDAETEWEEMVKSPDLVQEHWGEDNPITAALMEAIMQGLDFKTVRKVLKPYNTWRQISGD